MNGRRLLSTLSVAAALLGARSAAAHRLTCEETVNGQKSLVLQHYPVTLHYRLTVRNLFHQKASTATKVTDPVLKALGFKWTPSAPFTVPPGGKHLDTFNLLVRDQAECRRLAHLEGESDDLIDDRFTVTFDSGSASCTTTVRCGLEQKLRCDVAPPREQSLLQSLAVPASTVSLGTASSFAVLAGTTVTNANSTTIVGDVGVHPGSAITGFPPGTTVGTTHYGDATAKLAKSDLATAYDAVAAKKCGFNLTGTDLANQTLTPGVYCFSSAALLSGSLVLDAKGDQNAIFVFQIGSTLTTASGAVVSLRNGAQPCNVFWQVGSSATLGTGTAFQGNLLALTSITLTSGTKLVGRALARNGAVTLDSDNVVAGGCTPCKGTLCNGTCEAPDAGVCTPACNGSLCDGKVCIDLETDAANCGRCGNACRVGEACVSGTCRPPCNGNLCEGKCVQLNSDPKNCGACDRACASTECCKSGACVPPPAR